MQKFKFSWYNLFTTLNSLVLPKDQVSEPISDGDNVLEALAKLQAQVTELKNQAE